MKNAKKGFTIIELIVVIAIIAVLAAIVLVNVTQYIGKAKKARLEAALEEIAKAAQIDYATCGNWAPDVNDDEAPRFADIGPASGTIRRMGSFNCNGQEKVLISSSVFVDVSWYGYDNNHTPKIPDRFDWQNWDDTNPSGDCVAIDLVQPSARRLIARKCISTKGCNSPPEGCGCFLDDPVNPCPYSP